MNLNIVSKEKAKTLVSAIRREFQALDKGTAALSHNDCLNVLAKAQGFASWNAWEATLKDEKPSASPVAPKYPLSNNGEFDFIQPGENGLPFKGDFTRLEATLQMVEAKSNVVGARRAVKPNDRGEADSGFNLQYWRSEIYDDTMKAQCKNGNLLWMTEEGDQYAGVVVLAAEDHPHPQYDETLPVRANLIEAYLAYYAEHGIDDSAREGIFEKAEATLGIWLTEREAEHLLDQLNASTGT